MKNDILVVRKDHIVNRIRCKKKNLTKTNNCEDCLFFLVNTSSAIMLLFWGKNVKFHFIMQIQLIYWLRYPIYISYVILYETHNHIAGKPTLKCDKTLR